MGGVAVLNPQDCLEQPFSLKTLISPTHMKKPRNPNYNPNPNPNRANRMQPDRRKRSPTPPSTAILGPAPRRSVTQQALSSKSLIMGQVKILKRGEKLNDTASDKENLGVPDQGSTERLGLDTGSVPSRINLSTASNGVSGFYAGSSVFVASPPPSSLPLPAFFMKKCVPGKNEDVASDLRRILRLDLA
ncbi:hypothetical protein I3842_08G007900 [Carya illinoinensis]|uniref:Uncharacterized protein n=1 Tax=Carya illinoinensis TaxID=32201 RepID=A0A922J807_CARIL|nr:hypothetical protein I3842_08G007900 [Carya illinoinensis]